MTIGQSKSHSQQDSVATQSSTLSLPLAVLAPGPGAHRPRRLDERVGAAQQEAVAGGAGAAPLEGGLQRGRRPAVHRDYRHEPPVSHTGEYNTLL